MSFYIVQVELLLTLEEFCSEEGAFEVTGEGGAIFTPIFSQVCCPDVAANEQNLFWLGDSGKDTLHREAFGPGQSNHKHKIVNHLAGHLGISGLLKPR